MESEVVQVNRFSFEDIYMLSHKHFDNILDNTRQYSKEKIVGEICEFMDRISR